MRVVGFQGSHSEKLADLQEKSESVTLENCKARQCDDLEVVLKSNTSAHKTPMKFVSQISLFTVKFV